MRPVPTSRGNDTTSFQQSHQKEQFADFMHFFGGCLERCQSPIKDLVIDTRKRQVVPRFQAIYDFKAFDSEPKEEGYTAEYMVLFEMEETGTKVVRVEEFQDPQRLMEHVAPRAKRYAKSMNGKT